MEDLTSLVVPDCITQIGEQAFLGCDTLETLTLPFIGTDATNSGGNGVKDLFYSDSSYYHSSIPVKNLTITHGTSVPNSAFSGFSKLTNITLPSTITSIGSSAFSGCSLLESATLPNNLSSLGQAAFKRCLKLSRVTIPASVTTINTSLFEGCSALALVIIEDGINTIGLNTFKNCTSLFSLVLPKSITTVNKDAFIGCTKFGKSGTIFYLGDMYEWDPLCSLIDYQEITNFNDAFVCYYRVNYTSGGRY